MIYCIVHGLNALELSDHFSFGFSITRGYPLKLLKQANRVNSRAFSFANRRIEVWNSLDSDIVLAPSLYVFKNKLTNLILWIVCVACNC